jgi:sialic acid synthase SpsE/mannose-6-phosphate isomerase-like protein (cupin superfamily)
MSKIPKLLFVLEMANNHMGDISHGAKVIREFGAVCRGFPDFSFAFKLQYRDLDTFIHPEAKHREDLKYVKRFLETRLTRNDFDFLVGVMREEGFLTMSTPFDEASVDVVDAQRLDFIKVASCSFTDWPLLERIVQTNKPIIASTAGATLEEIDRVVSFLLHRQKDFAILHCVGEYPTPDENLHLSQIDFLMNRYPEVRIGFSTHEDPSNTDVVKLAVAKGARLFEKHVGVETPDYGLNAYSASPNQVRAWLEAATYALTLCGEGGSRLPVNPTEIASIRSLRRGVFARRDIDVGESIGNDDVYFAFPPEEGQYQANDWSKYSFWSVTAPLEKNAPLSNDSVRRDDVGDQVRVLVEDVKEFLRRSAIQIPGGVDLELSHHYGLDRFCEVGLTLMTVINRGYCKKLMVSLPGQIHPEQFHRQKEETFHILHGDVELTLDGVTTHHGPGSVVVIEPGVKHAWVSRTGAIIEEISSTHHGNDSFYTDEAINKNLKRKTLLTYWMD